MIGVRAPSLNSPKGRKAGGESTPVFDMLLLTSTKNGLRKEYRITFNGRTACVQRYAFARRDRANSRKLEQEKFMQSEQAIVLARDLVAAGYVS